MKRHILATSAVALALATLVTWTGCGARADLDASRSFQQAQSLFDQGTRDGFLQAAAEYESLLDRGLHCGPVYYNLGNAYMRAGERGRAIAAYRQAKIYMPTDPLLEANLASALGGTASTAGRPLAEHILFWQNWLAYPTKAWMTLALALATATFGVAALFQPKWTTSIAVALLVVTCLASVSVAYDWRRFDHVEHGVVTADETIARKGNAESYEPAFTEPLAEGTEFRVTGERGSWIRIALPDGADGWIERGAAVVY